jgi:Ca2+-binding EF-hand superfamily protein
MAEKWHVMLDFSISLDFDLYKKKLMEVFTKKQVLYQLAFDFYDSNNDEKISELDLYKIWQTFGQS